nr:MAG TPA: hypothetical protein [Caudoviricetes sp.]
MNVTRNSSRDSIIGQRCSVCALMTLFINSQQKSSSCVKLLRFALSNVCSWKVRQ